MHFRPELDHPEAEVLRHHTKESKMHGLLNFLQLILVFCAMRMLMLSMGAAIINIPFVDPALRRLLVILFDPM